jgi:hypothetical protein
MLVAAEQSGIFLSSSSREVNGSLQNSECSCSRFRV